MFNTTIYLQTVDYSWIIIQFLRQSVVVAKRLLCYLLSSYVPCWICCMAGIVLPMAGFKLPYQQLNETRQEFPHLSCWCLSSGIGGNPNLTADRWRDSLRIGERKCSIAWQYLSDCISCSISSVVITKLVQCGILGSVKSLKVPCF